MLIDPKPHLIVPFAQCSGDEWLQVVSALELKTLTSLLAGMKLIASDKGQSDSLSPPHERVWATALGLPTPTTTIDGLIPWAALEANASTDQAWAFITPCHWAMGREHATLTDPAALGITQADSRTLLAAMQPYFATEGITLHYLQPARWLAEGDIFRSLPTASLDRVLGRNVDRWLAASKTIKLLQNEMQMLLYTHPVNDERSSQGLPAVNSIWVSGSGALNEPVTANPQLKVVANLSQPAFAHDWTAYSKAWEQLDTSEIAHFLNEQKDGQSVRLSLCGESNAITFEATKHNFLTKIKSALNPQRPIDMLKQL